MSGQKTFTDQMETETDLGGIKVKGKVEKKMTAVTKESHESKQIYLF